MRITEVRQGEECETRAEILIALDDNSRYVLAIRDDSFSWKTGRLSRLLTSILSGSLWQRMVCEFHEKFGLSIEWKPTVPSEEIVNLRKKLVEEEFKELIQAIEEGNLAEIAKEACDLIYVVLGTMVSYGINLAPVFDAVHASNMLKVGGAKDASGKVLKPEGWKKPDIQAIIDSQ